jgi:hypothetical protein
VIVTVFATCSIPENIFALASSENFICFDIFLKGLKNINFILY